MKTRSKILIVAALAAGVAAALIAKRGAQSPPSADEPAPASPASPASATVRLPKLLDLGAGKCVPCKMMAPILDALKEEYAGRFQVEFIDVWQDPDAGKKYGIEMIPTQIFFDADGKERYRHVGFLGKEEILAKWKELGVDLGGRG